MGTAEFEYAVGINLLALESRALSTLFFPSSSVILYSNLFIILSTSLMTNENATDDAQGSPDEPPSFRNTTPAVTPSALSPNGTQRRLESIPLSPRRQRIHRTHGSRSENSVSVPGSTPGLFPFHGVVPDWPQSSLQPFAMPLTPQTPHIGTVHAGSTVSQVVHPSWP